MHSPVKTLSLQRSAQAKYGGQSMVGRLRRVVVCDPNAAGWIDAERWRELGFLHAPNVGLAEQQHEILRERLQASGTETVALQPGPESLDAVYVHDASLITDQGAILLRMGKAARAGESEMHRDLYEQLAIPILGVIKAPATAEAGDMVWLDDRTLMIGRGYRTNASGIEQMRNLLGPEVEVVSAPLPHGRGPSSCLHLMSLMSLLDERTVLVDSAWLAVETHEELKRRGFRLIEIAEDERESLACNVLALGEKRLLAFAENQRTNQRLREEGFEVLTTPGSEIGINGGGGPTCLTRPILREV